MSDLSMAADAKLVFASYADGGWSLEVYYAASTRGWWLDCSDIEYDHGLIRPNQLALVLSDYVLNLLADFEGGVFQFREYIQEMVKDQVAIGALADSSQDYPGFCNFVCN